MYFYLDIDAHPPRLMSGAGASAAVVPEVVFHCRDAVRCRLYFLSCGKFIDVPAGSRELVAKVPGKYSSTYVIRIPSTDFATQTDAAGREYLEFDLSFSGSAVCYALIDGECGSTTTEVPELLLDAAFWLDDGTDTRESSAFGLRVANNYRRLESLDPPPAAVPDITGDTITTCYSGAITSGAELPLVFEHEDTWLAADLTFAGAALAGVLLPGGGHNGQRCTVKIANSGTAAVELRVAAGVSPGIATVPAGITAELHCLYCGDAWGVLWQRRNDASLSILSDASSGIASTPTDAQVESWAATNSIPAGALIKWDSSDALERYVWHWDGAAVTRTKHEVGVVRTEAELIAAAAAIKVREAADGYVSIAINVESPITVETAPIDLSGMTINPIPGAFIFDGGQLNLSGATITDRPGNAPIFCGDYQPGVRPIGQEGSWVSVSTVSAGSPGTLTTGVAHGGVVNNRVRIQDPGTTGLDPDVLYWIGTRPSTTQMTLSTTEDNATPVTISADASPTIDVRLVYQAPKAIFRQNTVTPEFRTHSRFGWETYLAPSVITADPDDGTAGDPINDSSHRVSWWDDQDGLGPDYGAGTEGDFGGATRADFPGQDRAILAAINSLPGRYPSQQDSARYDRDGAIVIGKSYLELSREIITSPRMRIVSSVPGRTRALELLTGTDLQVPFVTSVGGNRWGGGVYDEENGDDSFQKEFSNIEIRGNWETPLGLYAALSDNGIIRRCHVYDCLYCCVQTMQQSDNWRIESMSVRDENFGDVLGAGNVDTGTGIFSVAGHTFREGDEVFVHSGTTPAELDNAPANGVKYYVKFLSTSTFQLAATPGGAAITYTSGGSGWYVRRGCYGLRIASRNINAIIMNYEVSRCLQGLWTADQVGTMYFVGGNFENTNEVFEIEDPTGVDIINWSCRYESGARYDRRWIDKDCGQYTLGRISGGSGIRGRLFRFDGSQAYGWDDIACYDNAGKQCYLRLRNNTTTATATVPNAANAFTGWNVGSSTYCTFDVNTQVLKNAGITGWTVWQ